MSEQDDVPVRDWVIPHKTRLDRRKATYGTYRYKGKAQDRLSQLRDGARVTYEVDEAHGQSLRILARASDGRCAEVAIEGSPDGVVAVTADGEDELSYVAVLYAMGLAMTWDWARALVVDAPACLRVGRTLRNRRGLEGVTVKTTGARRVLRARIVSHT